MPKKNFCLFVLFISCILFSSFVSAEWRDPERTYMVHNTSGSPYVTYNGNFTHRPAQPWWPFNYIEDGYHITNTQGDEVVIYIPQLDPSKTENFNLNIFMYRLYWSYQHNGNRSQFIEVEVHGSTFDDQTSRRVATVVKYRMNQEVPNPPLDFDNGWGGPIMVMGNPYKIIMRIPNTSFVSGSIVNLPGFTNYMVFDAFMICHGGASIPVMGLDVTKDCDTQLSTKN